MIKRLLAVPLLSALIFSLFVAAPAQAIPSAGSVNAYVRADLSQSNMLVSFLDTGSYATSQHYVCEGCVWGEGGSNKVFSEPWNMWVNPGWCSGDRFVYTNKNTGGKTYNAWRYLSGGSQGVSADVNPDNVSADLILTVEMYLVPHGTAGCVSYT